jgi:hypothetical protein
MDYRTSIHGRLFGIGGDGTLIVNRPDGDQELFGARVTVTVTSAQLLALNATPKTLIAAPGAGLAIIPRRVALYKPAGVAYAGVATGEDLVLKYTGTAGAQCSGVVETTGFLDQATAQTRVVGPPGASGATAGDTTPVANAVIVLHMLTGEIITGDSPLYVRVWYDVIKTVFTV